MSFWDGPTYGVIQAMKARGNKPGVIKQWVSLAEQWALDHRGPESEALRAWLPHFQPRPFYTAEELAPLWPALVGALGLAERPGVKVAARLRHELDYGRLPVLRNIDGTATFVHPATGMPARFYIVERIHHWSRRPFSQEEFEHVYASK